MFNKKEDRQRSMATRLAYDASYRDGYADAIRFAMGVAKRKKSLESVRKTILGHMRGIGIPV